jgi:hypothetical protein
MTMRFGEAERHINSFFPIGQRINWRGKQYTVRLSGKPTTPKGEPKTDIYVLLDTGDDSYEIKISVKKANADFLENKTSAERAEQIFGADWQQIVIDSTTQLYSKFMDKPLIYKEKYKRTEAGAITLGWKFEIMNKVSGELSDAIPLSRDQMIGIYAGTTLSEDKRHASVNGTYIENSGVANVMLFGGLEYFNSAEDILEELVPIEQYVDQHARMYFACKALNYRSFKDKYDGNRPLAVFVDWNNINGKLHPSIVFDCPLVTRGNEVANKLKHTLRQLGIRDTDDINSSNVSSLEYVHY